MNQTPFFRLSTLSSLLNFTRKYLISFVRIRHCH